MTVLHHAVRGEGPPVLLVHAGIADSRMWDPFADHLVAAGRRVVTCDLRGFGRTPLAPGVVSNPADLLALLDHLAIDRAAVVGASFGGLQALDLALRAPDRVSALVLLGSALERVRRLPGARRPRRRRGGGARGRRPRRGGGGERPLLGRAARRAAGRGRRPRRRRPRANETAAAVLDFLG